MTEFPGMGLLQTLRWRPARFVPARDTLLAPHRHRVERIRSLAGVPPAHWLALYMAALRGYACHLQQLAGLEAPENPSDALEQRLTVAVKALALRQGKLLPTDAEGQLGNQDLWTYALFSATLLCPSPQSAGNPVAELDDARDEARTPDLFPARDILPATGLAWLSEEPRVLRSWSLAIAGRLANAGDIGSLIAEAHQQPSVEPGLAIPPAVSVESFPAGAPADRTASRPDFSFGARMVVSQATSQVAADRCGQPHPTTTAIDETSDNPGLAFLAWLRCGLVDRSVPLNTRGSHVHVTPEGLFLVSPAIFRDFDQENWAQAQRRLSRLRLHQKNTNRGSIHSYSVRAQHGGGTPRGYLLPVDTDALSGIALPDPNPTLCRKDKRDTAGV